MADIPLQPLQHVKPESLGALVARAENERWTELILLGPGYFLGEDRERWPERYRAAPRVFQATEPIGAAGARALAALTGLTTLNLHDNDIGDVSQTGVQNNAEMPKSGWIDKLTSWRFFSLAAAAIAVVLANILYQADDPETRLLIAGSAAIFVGVYLFLASFNPDLIFRRLMAWTIGLGLLAHAGGSAFEAFFISDAATGSVRWVGTASLGFYVACTVIVAILAALEGWRMHKAA